MCMHILPTFFRLDSTVKWPWRIGRIVSHEPSQYWYAAPSFKTPSAFRDNTVTSHECLGNWCLTPPTTLFFNILLGQTINKEPKYFIGGLLWRETTGDSPHKGKACPCHEVITESLGVWHFTHYCSAQVKRCSQRCAPVQLPNANCYLTTSELLQWRWKQLLWIKHCD